ncbi:MAG: hypothetical protein M3R13_05635 [Armatimonadota bacterium]|nr:hypothetical protein [Armatimonadota bacterium]
MELWIILGWVVWGFVALFTLRQWEFKFKSRDGGVRILAGRCALLFTVALLVTALTPISKLHLLWACPALYKGSMMLTLMLMQGNLERAWGRMEAESRRTGEPLADILHREVTRHQALGAVRDYTPEERAEIESLVTSGDKEEGIARIEEINEARREELKAQGVDLEAFTPEIGRDFEWSFVVRQVFSVLEFTRGNTMIGPDGMPKSTGWTDPYGYLLVSSPIFNQPARLPIIHRDDFLLATFVFDEPNCDEILENSELLVTYAPEKTRRDGKAASLKHCLHYVLCPPGTLERYYAFNDDIHMRNPSPEKLFGKLKYDGEVRVETNQAPSI